MSEPSALPLPQSRRGCCAAVRLAIPPGDRPAYSPGEGLQ
jgi:hypothetical protein